jgi:hypothetical protein
MMGYSIRPAAVEQARPFLKEMVNSNEEIVWLSKDPNKFRYILHQAFEAAVALVDEYPQYAQFAQLKDKFKIVTDGNKVIARPKKVGGVAKLRVTEARMVFDDVSTVGEIIAALSQHHEPTELVFRDVELTKADLTSLYLVTEKYEYHIIPASETLTLSKREEDTDIAWTPEE